MFGSTDDRLRASANVDIPNKVLHISALRLVCAPPERDQFLTFSIWLEIFSCTGHDI